MKASLKFGLSVVIILSLFVPARAQGRGAGASRAKARAESAPAQSFLSPCRLPDGKTEARCGKFEVFENRAERRGRKIGLYVVVLPALGERHAPDPLFVFAGGPGQSAASIAGYLGEPFLAQVRRERDLVFIDQRGTGASNPLTCNLFPDDDLRGYFEEMFPPREVRACRERLEKAADLRQYTTANAIADFDDVRRALGYDRINLYGGSYGTTVALAYLRRFRPHVRTAVLAGVAPTDLKLPLPFARAAQFAMEHLIGDCAADPECGKAFPDLRAEFASVVERLAKNPASVELTNPATKQPQSIRLGPGIFAERLRMLLYSRAAAAVVPLLIHRAAQGDFRPFVLAALPAARNIYQSLSLGMYFSVTCSESVPFITEADIRRETAGTFLSDYRVRVHQDACREWPRADVPRAFTNAVNSDAPVLLLSGQYDPASPHWLGEEVVRHLPNGRQVTVPFGGHDYLTPCIAGLVAEFISRATVKGLDASCVAETRRPPFVTTLPPALSAAP